jgi:hypothetical protein
LKARLKPTSVWYPTRSAIWEIVALLARSKEAALFMRQTRNVSERRLSEESCELDRKSGPGHSRFSREPLNDS